MIEKNKIEKGVIDLFKVNMAVKKGEKVLVVTDVPTTEEWKNQNSEKLSDMVKRSVLAKMMSEIVSQNLPGCIVEFYTYPSVGKHGTNPGKEVEEKLKSVDAAVAVTSYSLSHTDARMAATKAGTRIASMPTFLPEMFYPGGPMATDYKKIADESKRMAELLRKAETATVKANAGTNLTVTIKGRDCIIDSGILADKGAFGNLPAGETFVAPVEGTAKGVLVVEQGWVAGLKENMVLRFDKGKVINIEGGFEVGDKFRELLGIGNGGAQFETRRNCAELGIGTNPNAKRPDNVLEAEKIRGTVHLAIGDNSHIGGKVSSDIHQDFIIPNATLILDGKTIIENGKNLFTG